MLLVIAILLVLVLIGIARCIVIVPQSNAYVTEWLGVYKQTQESGSGLQLFRGKETIYCWYSDEVTAIFTSLSRPFSKSSLMQNSIFVSEGLLN